MYAHMQLVLIRHVDNMLKSVHILSKQGGKIMELCIEVVGAVAKRKVEEASTIAKQTRADLDKVCLGGKDGEAWTELQRPGFFKTENVTDIACAKSGRKPIPTAECFLS